MSASRSNQSNNRKLVLIKPDFSSKKQRKSHKQYLTQQFFKAADRSDLAIVLECLHSGISINTHDNVGRTLFHIAAANDNMSLATMIINWPGRNLNMQTFDFQYSPLHEATMLERIEIIKLYLAAGAKVNLRDCHGATVVHIAVKLHAMDILKLLCAYKANLNICDVFENTPLSLAVLDKKSLRLSAFLLRRGARVNKNRKRSMYIFHETVVNCLTKEEVTFIKLLVKYGAFVNYVDMYGKNALHYAAIIGMPEVVHYLIRVGVKIMIKDQTRRTPYEIAREHGHHEACKLFYQRIKFLRLIRDTGIHDG